jgi:hypothetical protein
VCSYRSPVPTLRVPEAAERLGVSTLDVLLMIDREELPHRWNDRQLPVIPEDAVEALRVRLVG